MSEPAVDQASATPPNGTNGGTTGGTTAPARPAWHGLFGFEPVCFLALWLLFLSFGSIFFRDPGTLWHPVMGEWMLAHGEILDHDIFSYTEPGSIWYPQCWLTECVYALIYRATGLDGLLLFAATTLAGLYAWLGGRLRHAGMDPLLICPLMTLAMAVTMSHFHARPHLLTFVFMAWTLAWLCDVEAGRRPLWHLWGLVPAFALWANVHGGWLGGMGTFGFVAGGWIGYRLVGWQQPLKSVAQMGQVTAIGSALLLTMLATPFGWGMPEGWTGLMTSEVLPKYVHEHMPLYSGGLALTFNLVMLVLVLYLIALLCTLRWPGGTAPRVTWLVVLVWFLLGLSRQRNITLFTLSALVVLPDLWPQIRFVPWLGTHVSEFFKLRPTTDATGRWRSNAWGLVLPVLAVLTSCGLQLAAVPVPLIGKRNLQLDATVWPVQLIPRLQQYAARHPEGTRIFNDVKMGGFVMYHAPTLRIFMDDRCELYGDAGILRYVDAESKHPERVNEWADQYGFEWALVGANGRFDRYFATAPEWELVERAPAGVIYQRRAFAPLVKP